MPTIHYLSADELRKMPSMFHAWFRNYWERKSCMTTHSDQKLGDLFHKNEVLDQLDPNEYGLLVHEMGGIRKQKLRDIENLERQIGAAQADLIRLQYIGSKISQDNTMKVNYQLMSNPTPTL